MRITRDILLKLAQEAVDERVRADRGIVSAIVTGSMLRADPLLGGTTDIDLVLIHDLEPIETREIVRISPEIHLDIAHHSQAAYRYPRHLRQDFWLGSTINESPIVLHDLHHWFEFTQASIRSQFWDPENVIARVRPLADEARQGWLKLQNEEISLPEQTRRYLDLLELASNAIAGITGSPLTERRFLIDYEERTKAVDNPGLATGLGGLIGAAQVNADQVRAILPAWQQAFHTAGTHTYHPANLNPQREVYFSRAIEDLLDHQQVAAALWPLTRTWTQALLSLDSSYADYPAWNEAFALLHLDPASLPERLTGMDAYLDAIEETLEQWAQNNGV